MKLYNQRRVAIRFDGGGHDFRWEPYGSCVVPDSLFPHLKECGFPVAITPVPPEARAAAVAAEAATIQRGDEVELLKSELSLARSDAATSKTAAEEASVKVTGLLGELDAAKAETSAQVHRAEQLDLSRHAAEQLLAETAKKLESAEARVLAAEAERDIAKAEVERLSAGTDKKPKK